MKRPKPALRDGHWNVYFRYQGRRYRRRFPSRELAEAYIAGVLSPGSIAPAPAKDRKLPALIEEYHRWGESVRKKSLNTIRNQRQMLAVFCRWTAARGIGSVTDISTRDIDGFQAYYFDNFPFHGKPNHRRKKSDGTATWNKYVEALSAFFGWCVRREILTANPAPLARFRIKVQKQIPRTLSKSEIQRILAFLDEFYGEGGKIIPTFFRLLLYTGLRLSEAVKLEWSQVDMTGRIIRVLEYKTKDVRSIPISPALLPHLKALPRNNRYLFDGGDDTPIYEEGRWWKILRQVTNALKIRPLRIHDLRHTFAANLAMAGVDIGSIQKLLGHSDIRTTQIYLHFSPDHLKEAVSKLQF